MSVEIKTCPLCGRQLGTDVNEHHLIPRSFKGKETVTLHRICHDHIHHVISEREMLNQYNTVESLRDHPDVKSFIHWVRNKHPDFYIRIRDSKGRNRRR
jgi:hypothetical protein